MDTRAVSLEEFLLWHKLALHDITLKVHTKTSATILINPGIGLLEPKQGVSNEKASASSILQERQSSQN